MKSVSALFIDPTGYYPKLLGPENCWDVIRDARTYAGPHPVVAHPPCQLWVNLAAVNYKRATAKCEACSGFGLCAECMCTRRKEPNRKIILPAWYPGGDDGGCFASALSSVRKFNGVLEHPAGSHAWAAHGLFTPSSKGWAWATFSKDIVDSDINGAWDYFVCEVWQSAYGHKARKRTWLLYCGKRPPELNWSREPGTHQIGWFDREKPTLNKREASLSPLPFAKELIKLAGWSYGN